MTTDLAPRNPTMTSLSLGDLFQLGEVLTKTGFLPEAIKTPAQAVAVMLKGQELGVPPMYALSNIGIIHGKPVCQAELMLALIYRDQGDKALDILETNEKVCRVRYQRRGGPAHEMTFTIEDAERAGLIKQNANYGKYPAAMLRARVISAAARAAFPDSIAGMYTPEEMGARVVVNDLGEVVLDAEPAPVERPRQAISAATPAAPDRTQLEQREVDQLLEGLEQDYKDATDQADVKESHDALPAFWDRLTGPEQANVKRWEKAAVERVTAAPSTPEPEPVPA